MTSNLRGMVFKRLPSLQLTERLICDFELLATGARNYRKGAMK